MAGSEKVRVGVVGYGNLGRGVETALKLTSDMELAAVYSRRDPATVAVAPGTVVRSMADLEADASDLDVLILCGGSASDLPEQTPALAAKFNLVDSFDTHARIPDHFAAADAAAKAGNKVALISAGWDPGLFSLNRLFGEAILPQGSTATFWGPGVSQGHSDAVRRVPGVAAAVQYTVPADAALAAVRDGSADASMGAADRHLRKCFVVLEDGASADEVREAIVTMPHYFAPYETTVTFVTAEELQSEHGSMPHGGVVIRSGEVGEHRQRIEFQLALGDNPGFTASVLVAYARAVVRLAAQGRSGAVTVFDVPPGLLDPRSAEQLRAELL